jgi:hypothetical protein
MPGGCASQLCTELKVRVPAVGFIVNAVIACVNYTVVPRVFGDVTATTPIA